jgi:hypothetical protein
MPKKTKKEMMELAMEPMPGQVEITVPNPEETQENLSKKKDLSPSLELETDENKNTEQLWRTKRMIDSTKFILGYDPFFKDAQYKIYKDQIKMLTSVRYFADLSCTPPVQTGEKYFVSHSGVRISDHISKELFDELEGDYPTHYSFVDMADPVASRYTYSTITGSIPSQEDVNESRYKRLYKKESDEVEKESTLSYTMRAPIKRNVLENINAREDEPVEYPNDGQDLSSDDANVHNV